jgi:hypothetical protein
MVIVAIPENKCKSIIIRSQLSILRMRAQLAVVFIFTYWYLYVYLTQEATAAAYPQHPARLIPQSFALTLKASYSLSIIYEIQKS